MTTTYLISSQQQVVANELKLTIWETNQKQKQTKTELDCTLFLKSSSGERRWNVENNVVTNKTATRFTRR